MVDLTINWNKHNMLNRNQKEAYVEPKVETVSAEVVNSEPDTVKVVSQTAGESSAEIQTDGVVVETEEPKEEPKIVLEEEV